MDRVPTDKDLSEIEVKKILMETGAMLQGHFVLTSGMHSGQYIQCAQVLQYPNHAERLCHELARRFKDDSISTVVAPAVGGILVAYEVARGLGVRALFTERENGKVIFRRGFSIKPGEKVLVVEDVVTTGGSVVETMDTVRRFGGEVVGVGLLVDRSGGRVSFDVRQEVLLTLDASSATYKPEECPLCRDGVPVTKPGSRKA